MIIRPATESDASIIVELVRELAIYEREEDQVAITTEDVRKSFFSHDPCVFCDLVEDSPGEVVGFAVWFINYSTWSGHCGIYLEDLFVRPAYRGRGHGRALLARLARECVERGYTRLQWSVLDWNTPARDFYSSLGAQAMEEWTVYRLEGTSLGQLADSGVRGESGVA